MSKQSRSPYFFCLRIYFSQPVTMLSSGPSSLLLKLLSSRLIYVTWADRFKQANDKITPSLSVSTSEVISTKALSSSDVT